MDLKEEKGKTFILSFLEIGKEEDRGFIFKILNIEDTNFIFSFFGLELNFKRRCYLVELCGLIIFDTFPEDE